MSEQQELDPSVEHLKHENSYSVFEIEHAFPVVPRTTRFGDAPSSSSRKNRPGCMTNMSCREVFRRLRRLAWGSSGSPRGLPGGLLALVGLCLGTRDGFLEHVADERERMRQRFVLEAIAPGVAATVNQTPSVLDLALLQALVQ